MSTIYLVQGDTRPQLQVTATREGGSVIDLTDSTVLLKIRRKNIRGITLTLTGTLSDPTNGVAVFAFSDGDLDIDAGDYQGEVEVTYSTGDIETAYDLVDINLRRDFE